MLQESQSAAPEDHTTIFIAMHVVRSKFERRIEYSIHRNRDAELLTAAVEVGKKPVGGRGVELACHFSLLHPPRPSLTPSAGRGDREGPSCRARHVARV